MIGRVGQALRNIMSGGRAGVSDARRDGSAEVTGKAACRFHMETRYVETNEEGRRVQRSAGTDLVLDECGGDTIERALRPIIGNVVDLPACITRCADCPNR